MNREGILLEPNVIACFAKEYPYSIFIHNILEEDKYNISTPVKLHNVAWAFQSTYKENAVYGDYLWISGKCNLRLDIKSTTSHDFATITNSFYLKPEASKEDWFNNWRKYLSTRKLDAYVSAAFKNPLADLLGKYEIQPGLQKYVYFSFNVVKAFIEEVMLTENVSKNYAKAIGRSIKYKIETNKETGKKETVKYESEYLKLYYVHKWYSELPEERKKDFIVKEMFKSETP